MSAATVIPGAAVVPFLFRVAGAVAAGRPVVEAVASAGSVAEAASAVAVARAEAGDFMRTKEFLSKLDHDRITEAIREAESKTSGEIRVFVQRGKLEGDPLPLAEKKFHKLGMLKTPERNAALIFVAPRAHKFAVIGDQGIHEKCGGDYWQQIVARMSEHFQSERFTDAIVDAVREIGNVLARHFPAKPGDRNDFSDEVIEG